MKNTENNKNLYRRYLDDLYTTEDARQILNSLHDPDNHETLNELSSDVWEEAATQHPLTDLERERYKREARQLLKRIEHKKRTWFRRIALAIISTAAMVCLILGGIHYLKHINERQIIYMEVATSYGERKQVFLPDGTQLTLNSCSHVRYPNRFIGEERRIELEGEGYFQVHRNEEQPFIVSTCRFDVRVLGTCFDIKSYSSDEIVSVEVESGKVQVDLPEAMMRLKGKEQVLINTISGEYSKRREERPVAIWKKGGLRFNSTPIRDVAKELERMYNCRIAFADGQFNNLISGEHDNKSLEAVLQSIEYTSGIRYKKEGNRILLHK
ncbi:FecR domain-containing protein [uncultured Bacteroides sp.]|uniref:FecR family protein n=1 Tax=uncultured Bacteroides sp. TaxID=162156 RepID=UPI0025D1B7BD|nr:FecR domain-containing protein [uncultured Bacteroides sp.]